MLCMDPPLLFSLCRFLLKSVSWDSISITTSTQATLCPTCSCENSDSNSEEGLDIEYDVKDFNATQRLRLRRKVVLVTGDLQTVAYTPGCRDTFLPKVYKMTFNLLPEKEEWTPPFSLTIS